MQCPKCGTENPDDNQSCKLCDGIPHTEDDIKLAINPEVLNLTN